MRTERRTSGSARGDEKLAAERRYGAHRLLTRFMRQWSSGMIRNCAANPSQSRYATAGPSSAPLPMMRDVLACVGEVIAMR